VFYIKLRLRPDQNYEKISRLSKLTKMINYLSVDLLQVKKQITVIASKKTFSNVRRENYSQNNYIFIMYFYVAFIFDEIKIFCKIYQIKKFSAWKRSRTKKFFEAEIRNFKEVLSLNPKIHILIKDECISCVLLSYIEHCL